jgi:dihydrofolate synthase/folylpolyglutamate synthase
MTYREAVEYLTTLHAFGWRLDLSRMEALCERLDHPERAFRVVHVAGTNGKGSTTAMIASILAHAGYRVGSYFSPYVFNLRERVMLAEPGRPPEMIPEDDFARLMTVLRPHVEAVAADETIGHPTEFEVKTAIAFLYFRERKVDWAVLEVGLGGRLDATNVVPSPDVCVITNIGLDHTERLGDTLEKIAGEKAGIIKRGAAVVTAAEEPALSVIRRTSDERGASGFVRISSPFPALPTSVASDRDSSGEGGQGVRDPRASYQQLNAALAEAAAHALRLRGVPIPDEAIARGIASAWLPGRFQMVREKPVVILDGAHNREAAEALAASLRSRFGGRQMLFVIGQMGRHAAEGLVAELAPLAGVIIATQPTQGGGHPAEHIAGIAEGLGVRTEVVIPPMEALRRALELATEDDVVVVTGSFYVVGEIDVAALESA